MEGFSFSIKISWGLEGISSSVLRRARARRGSTGSGRTNTIDSFVHGEGFYYEKDTVSGGG
jgi:hypothetical protein